MISAPDRRETLQLIGGAVAAGALNRLYGYLQEGAQ